MGWKGKSPLEMANRIVACDILRSIGPQKINMIEDEKIKNPFLVFVLNDKNEEIPEIDWEFVIFEATEFQIGKVIGEFQPKRKEKPKSDIKIVKR